MSRQYLGNDTSHSILLMLGSGPFGLGFSATQTDVTDVGALLDIHPSELSVPERGGPVMDGPSQRSSVMDLTQPNRATPQDVRMRTSARL